MNEEAERPKKRRLVRARGLRARYDDVCDRTISRWVEAGVLPAPLVINNVRFWDEDELDRPDRERISD
jgi:hypothetical protein